MLSSIRGKGKGTIIRLAPIFFLTVALLAAGFCTQAFAAKGTKQRSFSSPEDAVRGLGVALRSEDPGALSDIFGPEGKDLIESGDAVLDKERRGIVTKMFEEQNRIVMVSDRKAVLELGAKNWPLPIPVVLEKGTWHFDTKAGRREILNRRIGKDELAAIEVCRAYVEAQREYATSDHDGGLKEYAQKFFSEPGKKDGLYWEPKDGAMSPMGLFVANASKEGYRRPPEGSPAPYHGYYYSILKAQGKNAAGGAYDYVVRGKMIGGFALVAYPARYGSSGIMTFLVNHRGIVYQKDLGPKTESAATAIKLFDPDKSWKVAK